MDLFWSSLPGIPKKLKWPVHVIKWEQKDKVLVFSRSDNSYFKVSRDQLVPFPGQLEKFKDLGLGLLKRQRKEGTLKEFEADIQWALDEATAEDSAKKKPGLSSKPRKKKYETKDDVTSEESSVSDYVDEDDKVEESLPHSPSQKVVASTKSSDVCPGSASDDDSFHNPDCILKDLQKSDLGSESCVIDHEDDNKVEESLPHSSSQKVVASTKSSDVCPDSASDDDSFHNPDCILKDLRKSDLGSESSVIDYVNDNKVEESLPHSSSQKVEASTNSSDVCPDSASDDDSFHNPDCILKDLRKSDLGSESSVIDYADEDNKIEESLPHSSSQKVEASTNSSDVCHGSASGDDSFHDPDLKDLHKSDLGSESCVSDYVDEDKVEESLRHSVSQKLNNNSSLRHSVTAVSESSEKSKGDESSTSVNSGTVSSRKKKHHNVKKREISPTKCDTSDSSFEDSESSEKSKGDESTSSNSGTVSSRKRKHHNVKKRKRSPTKCDTSDSSFEDSESSEKSIGDESTSVNSGKVSSRKRKHHYVKKRSPTKCDTSDSSFEDSESSEKLKGDESTSVNSGTVSSRKRKHHNVKKRKRSHTKRDSSDSRFVDSESSEKSKSEESTSVNSGTVSSRKRKHHNVKKGKSPTKQKQMTKLESKYGTDKLRDISNRHIYVSQLQSSEYHILTGGKKKHKFVWNQVHCCKFCKKIVTNISKHMKNKIDHKKKKEVVEILQLSKEKGSKNKMVRAKWDMLRNEGDHCNNMDVLSKGEGEFIISRRSHNKLDVSSYGPCPSCLAWLKLDKTMFRHQKLCPAVILGYEEDTCKTTGEIRIRSLGLSGKLNSKASKVLKDEVFTMMTKDDVSNVAQNDPLIISLGNLWMLKNIGNKLKRKYYTSSRMRGAARLLLNARKVIGNDICTMHEILVTDRFNDVVTAALMTASPNFDDIEDLKSPSAAIKIGYDIKRMLGAKWANALREKCQEDRREVKDFFKLMEIEWSYRVTRLASTLLQTRRFNAEKSLPEPSDLVDLQNHIKKEIKELNLNDSSPEAYRRTCVLAEARLLLYNKRRAGEVEGIGVKEYVKRHRGVSNIERSMRSELTALEEKLLESQELLETRGKYGRGVPVIIPSDARDILLYLASSGNRTNAGIRPSNRYLFPNSSDGVIRAYDALKKVCSQIDLLKPEKITSVNLRKYTATISQVFDLSEQQQTWLVNHLGHSMDIHKIHYRQTSGTVERLDISKLMLLQEFNLTAKYAGKRLDDIKLTELVFDTEKDEVVLNDEEQEDLPEEAAADILQNDEPDSDYQPGLDAVEEAVFDEFDFCEDDIEEQPKKVKSTSHDQPQSNASQPVLYTHIHTMKYYPRKRQKWTPAEMAELTTYFKENINTLTTPGMKTCLKAIQSSKSNNGQLCKRSWETVKKKVWNLIQKKK